MQYILTQQEYDDLVRAKRKQTEADIKQLQEVCTLAAMHIPVVVEWSRDKTPKPWGCILGPKEQDPGYCDLCPVSKVCPYNGKEWSK